MSEQFGQELILGVLQSARISDYCILAALTLVLYDHLATIPRECHLMWGRRLSSVIVLFYLNRWAIIIWAISPVTIQFLPLDTVSSCSGLNYFGTAMELLLFGTWAVFSSIRIYAVSRGSWSLAIVTGLLGAVPLGTNVYRDFIVTSVVVAPFPGLVSECGSITTVSQATSTRFAIGTRICLIASDLMVLGSTWSRTYALKRESDRHGIRTPLATLLLRDGTMYFIVLLALNVLNFAGQITNVFSYALTFSTPISSLIITHFLLNLRQLAEEPQADVVGDQTSLDQFGNGSRPSTIKFSRFVGNMGELMDHSVGSIDPDIDWMECKNNSVDPKGDTELMEASDYNIAGDTRSENMSRVAGTI